MTAKDITRVLRLLNRVPMTAAEKRAAALRREHIQKHRRKVVRKLLRLAKLK
jgi:hypothetical protein